MIYKSEFEVPENVNDWIRDKIMTAKILIGEIETLHPCRLLYILDNEGSIENVTVELTTDSPLLFTVEYDGYRKQYSVTPLRFYEIGELYSVAESEVPDMPKWPNRIGKINRKKIDEWIKFHEERHRAYMRAKSEKETFYKATRDRIDALKSEGVEVHWTDTAKTRGCLDRNGIEFLFSIETRHLYGELRFCALSNLDNFIALSDNKYKGDK